MESHSEQPAMRKTTVSAGVALALAGWLASSASASAQDADPAASQTLERVTVTGSSIPRIDAQTPSPVQVITADDLKQSGATTVSEALSRITANGQGTLSQGFSGAFASGSSGVALRGLTVGATLVLIDGHRMAPYPIGDDGQRSFVDISNIPFDTIERIEVLKDGASAVYGSDAIAGVVNVILKRSFVGKTVTADFGTSRKADGNIYHFAGTVGGGDLGSDGHNGYVSIEARHQDQITFADRGGRYTKTDYTSTGGLNVTRGVVNTANGGLPLSGTGYVADPAATSPAGFFAGCDATKFAAGQCTYNNTWSQIQPKTSNLNLVGRFTQNLSPDWQGSVQATYFESRAQQVGGPSTTFNGYQGITSGPGVTPTLLPASGPTTISATNPSFPAGTGLSTGNLTYTFLNLGPTVTTTDARSARLIADVQGTVAGWDVNAAIGHTQVLLYLAGYGSVNAANLQAALDSTTNPYLIGGPNSAAADAFIAPTLRTGDSSRLDFAHVGATRELMQLSGGPLQIAFGGDYFYRRQYATAPADVAAGLVSTFSNNFTIGTQKVASLDAEIVAPITKKLEAEAAVRYDHYNLSGGKAAPKAGFKYQAIPEFAVRGTVARGFRAPGPAENGSAGQTFFTGLSADPVLCPSNHGTTGYYPSQCSIPVGTVQGTNPALKPERSKSYTLGLLLQPIREVTASIDFYSIEIDDQIVVGGGGGIVRGTNFAPIPYIQADGTTVNQAPATAPIAYETATYVNANTTKTSGLDAEIQWRHQFADVVNFKSDLMVTYTNKYDLTVDGVTYKLAGTHGPVITSGDTGNPKTHLQWANTFSRGDWELTGTINYVSSFNLTDPSYGVNDCATGLLFGAGATPYQDQLNATPATIPYGVSCRVASFTTFDLAGRYEVSKKLSLHASVLNLFNSPAPYDWGTYGGGNAPYNPSLHLSGAIGRYFNAGLTYNF